jgi:hypothetical protein
MYALTYGEDGVSHAIGSEWIVMVGGGRRVTIGTDFRRWRWIRSHAGRNRNNDAATRSDKAFPTGSSSGEWTVEEAPKEECASHAVSSQLNTRALDPLLNERPTYGPDEPHPR